MVDFNNESTVATPPGDVVKIVLLERREQVIEAWESYNIMAHGGVDPGNRVAVIRARLMALWHEVQAMAKRRLKKEAYAEIVEAIENMEKPDELMIVWEWLNEFLDEMGLTYVDSRARYDRTRVEDANRKKGL